MTPSTLHRPQARTQKVPVLRVKREFHHPEVVAWLETVDEEELAALVTDEVDFELTPEEVARVEEGFAQIDAGRGIPHEAMEAWAKSWGTDAELPEPRAK